MPAIEVSGLRKAYGNLEAVRGVDFTIETGEVFGLLGPNGAGKTTTVEILEGYRKRDGGEVRVLGHDPERPGPDFRERIGVVLQSSELWPNLTVRETHAVFAGYYAHPRDVDEVIALVGLEDKANARVKTLSGGQKRRLDLGVALVGDPELVFLDEPTTGFDPAARRAAWEMIRSLRSLGKTVLLTTHYLDEAEQLADRVAVLRDGVIVRLGTPRELTTADLEVEIRYRSGGEDVVVRTTEPTRVLNELTGDALARGEELDSLEVRRPTLEQVYLDLVDEETGRRVKLFVHQFRTEQLVFWRSREAAFFIFIFPLLLFVLLGSVYYGRLPGRAGQVGGARRARRVRLREHGVRAASRSSSCSGARAGSSSGSARRLCRRRPTSWRCSLSTLVVFALQTIALFVLGRALYGTPFPRRVGSLAVTLVHRRGRRSPRSARRSRRSSAPREGSSAVVNFILLPMAFLSGAFGPTTSYPAVLRAIGDVLPLTYLVKLVDAVYLHGQGFWTQPEAIAVLAAWGVAGVVVHGVEVPVGATREIEPAVALLVRRTRSRESRCASTSASSPGAR